jgi:hypothetical protein
MKRISDIICNRIKNFLSNPTELSVIVEDRIGWFEELVEDDFFFVVNDSAAGKFETDASGDHLAVDDQD